MNLTHLRAALVAAEALTAAIEAIPGDIPALANAETDTARTESTLRKLLAQEEYAALNAMHLRQPNRKTTANPCADL